MVYFDARPADLASRAQTTGTSMRIDVRVIDPLPPAVVHLVRKLLEFRMARFAGRVASLTVRLGDVNGPRGGVDKKCSLAIRLADPKRLIVIEDTDTAAEAAIRRAVDRAGRAVARAVHTELAWRSVQFRNQGDPAMWSQMKAVT